MRQKYKKKSAILLALVLGIVTIAGCNSNTTNEDTNNVTKDSEAGTDTSTTRESSDSTTVESLTLEAQYDEEDTDSSWDESTSTIIQLNGDSIKVSGDGATVTKDAVTISQAGTYVLRGTLDDGQVVIDSDKEDLVRLVLDGVDMTSSTSAPIYAAQEDKLVLILADDSTNTITDASEYVYSDAETDEPNAAIFSKDDLTINGTGSLTVNGNYNNGIGSQDDLVIISGTITVTAVNIAIKGKDSLTVADGTLNITSSGDGLKSNNDTDAEKGWILIENGTFDITANNDAIQAETDLLILDGTFNLVTNEGSASVSHGTFNEGGVDMMPSDGDFRGGNMGGGRPDDTFTPGESQTTEGSDSTDETVDGDTASTISTIATAIATSTTTTEASDAMITTTTDKTTTDETTSDVTADTTESDSYKGIKATTGLEIRGGTFTIDSADDSLHSNGNVIIQAGDLSLSSGDDGIHANETLLINDGTITIPTSYEGIEGSTIIINNGTVTIKASDDGMNAAGGFDGATEQGAFGQDQFGSSGDHNIYISGGQIMVEAAGDGIDSNGDITMTGGTVLVNGPTSGADGALDYDGEFNISGGTLVAAGSLGMALATSDSSTQAALLLYYTTTQSADTLFHVESSEGESILSFAPSKEYQSILISTPELTTGSSYKIYSGGSDSAENVNGLHIGGTYTAGTEVIEPSLESVVTSITDTGTAVSSGMGGMRGGGGRGGTMPDGTAGESMELPEGMALPEGGMGGQMPSGERPDRVPGGYATQEETTTVAK